jgi:hypothetical protein
MSCEIELEGKVHTGVIRDLSRQGLFVTSRFEVEPGTPVLIRVRRSGGEIWEIQATTARNADRSQALFSRRGLGLVIEEAPLSFHEFVAELERNAPVGPPRVGEPGGRARGQMGEPGREALEQLDELDREALERLGELIREAPEGD